MKNIEINKGQSEMAEEGRRHSYLDEGMDFLQKTIDKQRSEINAMKEQVYGSEKRAKEAQASRDSFLNQVTKEREDLETKMKRKSSRYKKKIKQMLIELENITQRNQYIQNESCDSQIAYNKLIAKYEQDSGIFRLENHRKDRDLEKHVSYLKGHLTQAQSKIRKLSYRV